MDILFEIENITTSSLEIHVAVTHPDNPYFKSGDALFIERFTEGKNYWTKVKDGDFVLIPSNGHSVEKTMVVKVSFESNTIVFSPLSSYVTFKQTSYDITELKNIQLFGKLLGSMTPYDQRFNVDRFKRLDD